jgi:hypothetical protein
MEIAGLASAPRLSAAKGVLGTIWDIGEAAGPIIADFLIRRAGLCLDPSIRLPS